MILQVGAVDIDETAGFILEKAIKDGNQAELEKYLLEAVQTFHEIQHAGNGEQSLVLDFLPTFPEQLYSRIFPPCQNKISLIDFNATQSFQNF